jgi:hypothetical protein
VREGGSVKLRALLNQRMTSDDIGEALILLLVLVVIVLYAVGVIR